MRMKHKAVPRAPKPHRTNPAKDQENSIWRNASYASPYRSSGSPMRFQTPRREGFSQISSYDLVRLRLSITVKLKARNQSVISFTSSRLSLRNSERAQ